MFRNGSNNSQNMKDNFNGKCFGSELHILYLEVTVFMYKISFCTCTTYDELVIIAISFVILLYRWLWGTFNCPTEKLGWIRRQYMQYQRRNGISSRNVMKLFRFWTIFAQKPSTITKLFKRHVWNLQTLRRSQTIKVLHPGLSEEYLLPLLTFNVVSRGRRKFH